MPEAAKYWTVILEPLSILLRIAVLSSAEPSAPNELMRTRMAEHVPLLSLWM